MFYDYVFSANKRSGNADIGKLAKFLTVEQLNKLTAKGWTVKIAPSVITPEQPTIMPLR